MSHEWTGLCEIRRWSSSNSENLIICDLDSIKINLIFSVTDWILRPKALPIIGAQIYRTGEPMPSPEDEVRAASERFYAGLNQMANGDAGPLDDIWSHAADATTMHPIGGREVGWGKVQGSFQQVARVASEGRISLEDQIIRVTGDLAYELGIERGVLKLMGQQAPVDGRVTNIYRREAGNWKIVHHHTDLCPAMLEVLNLLPAKT
jgi:ketosteroid isomerase-like protein